MISSPDIALWICATVLSGFVVFLVVARGQFRRFSTLAMYFVLSSAVSMLRMAVLYTYGFNSREYGYCYYFSDLLLTLLLYFVIASLYRKVFPSAKARLRVRIASSLLVAVVGVWTFVSVSEYSSRILSRWIVEYGQDLYFVTLPLAVALLGFAVFKANVPKAIRQLTFVFAVYYLFLTLVYVIRNFIVTRGNVIESAVLFHMWLPLGVAYVFCDSDFNNSPERLRSPL